VERPVTDANDANDTTDELRAHSRDCLYLAKGRKGSWIIRARARSQVTNHSLRNYPLIVNGKTFPRPVWRTSCDAHYGIGVHQPLSAPGRCSRGGSHAHKSGHRDQRHCRIAAAGPCRVERLIVGLESFSIWSLAAAARQHRATPGSQRPRQVHSIAKR
jgi:hypothetical protein